MTKTIPKEHEFIEFALPHVNFKDYELVSVEKKKNNLRRKDTYEERLRITIQEKPIPPDDS